MKRALMVLGGAVALAALVALIPASHAYDPAPLVRALKESAQAPIPVVAAAQSSIILTNARITDTSPSHPTAIRIENGVITAIADDVGSDLPVKDLLGAFVSPGLMDAHVHLSMAPGAAVRMDDAATSALLRAWHLRAYLACGVTTILDPAVDEDVAQHIQRTLAAGAPGPRYLHLGPPLVVAGGYVSDLFPHPLSDDVTVSSHLQRVKAAGAVGAKLPIEPGPFLPIWNTPSDELLATIAQQTQQHGLPLYVHAMTEDAFARGLTLRPHAFVHLTDTASGETVAKTATSGAYVISTLAIWDVHHLVHNAPALKEPHVARTTPPQVARGLVDDDLVHRANTGLVGEVLPILAGRWSDISAWFQSTPPGRAILGAMYQAKLDSSSDVLLRMHRAGVPLVLGSDSGNWPVFPYYLHGSTTLRELELLARAGLSGAEVLATATRNPARMLGLEEELGSVAVGKQADLVVTAQDPRDDVKALRNIALVVKGGVARTPQEWMDLP